MPIVDGQSVSPDEAIHRGLCPECGASLNVGTARNHAEGHWVVTQTPVDRLWKRDGASI